jgi:ribosomal protein S1
MKVEEKVGDLKTVGIFDDIEFTSNGKIRNKESKEYKYLYNLYNSTGVKMPEVGEMISSQFVRVTESDFLFNVDGYKDYIRVDNKPSEFKYFKNLNVGDYADILILDVNHDNFYIKGSVAALYESIARTNLKSLQEGESVIVTVKSLTPAGYVVELIHEGITFPGFMPNTLAGINKLHDPSVIVGETFNVMIETYSNSEGTYIVNRRKYLHTLIPDAIKELEYGKIYDGCVTGTTKFGVFVEFNECLTGMIHKANIIPEWSERIEEILPGFEIQFFIKEIIKNKIILTQLLRETIWDTIKNGQIIEGVVKDVKPFGALIILDEETMGLIHTSEIEKCNKKLSEGQKISTKVLAVDRSNRKIFLTFA